MHVKIETLNISISLKKKKIEKEENIKSISFIPKEFSSITKFCVSNYNFRDI